MTFREAQETYSPIEVEDLQLSSPIFDNIHTTISHTNKVLNHLTDYHKIIEPDYYDRNVDFYKEKRDTAKCPHIKQYWHNRIVELFFSANQLLTYMTPIDEAYYGIYTVNIKKVLDLKKDEYSIGTFTT